MSWPFAVVHLYLRHLKGQGVGYLSPINRTRAVQPQKWYLEQLEPQENAPIRFYSANDLCDYTRAYNDHDWECKRDLPGLHPRKTNHEYITHGIIEYPEFDRLKQVSWAALVAFLFELVPELEVCSDHMALGLYTVLRYLRILNYNRVYATTDRELELAQEIAWLHTRLRPEEKRDESRPHLWMLLHALTFRKRAAGDQLFQKLIRKLGYNRKFLLSLPVLRDIALWL